MGNLNGFSSDLLISELNDRLNQLEQLKKQELSLMSDLADLNNKLREGEKVKSSFLSNIRNEINNPLTSILGLSRQLMSESFDLKSIKRISELINKEAFNLDFQLRNIHFAAEIEAGEIDINPATININNVIQSQINYFCIKQLQKNVNIDYQNLDSSLFKTDPVIFDCIVMNLLSNAIEYSPYGGKIIISTVIEKNKLIISFRDFGIGIDAENKKRIFERFRQLESGTKKSHGGHGLGLSIVKEFTDSLSGEIDIITESITGTLVKITLPSLESIHNLYNYNFSTENASVSDDPEIF